LENSQDAIPTTEGDGQAENDHPRGHIHSIPHTQSSDFDTTQSSENTNMSETCKNTDSQDVDLEGKKDEVVTLPVESGNEGVGVVEKDGDGMDVEYKEVPPSNSETKG
jgi:hypothetical protein